MATSKFKRLILGTTLAGGLIASGTALFRGGHDKDKDEDKEEEKTEIVSTPETQQHDENDPYGNVALFNANRSKIKFALAFVEGFAPTAYQDKNENGTWTVGHGLTILYNDDGSHSRVNKDSKCTLEQSDEFKDRYLTYDILPDIQKSVTVSMDENTLIATCVFRYCIGHANFKKSTYLKQLNAGKTGADLARYLTGFRRQKGVLKRLYFFAALMSDEISFSDLVNLHAEGCYDLILTDIVECDSKGNIIKDKENMATWNFSKMDDNLARAQTFGNREFIKDVVPEYIWNDVYADETVFAESAKTITFGRATKLLKQILAKNTKTPVPTEVFAKDNRSRR